MIIDVRADVAQLTAAGYALAVQGGHVLVQPAVPEVQAWVSANEPVLLQYLGYVAPVSKPEPPAGFLMLSHTFTDAIMATLKPTEYVVFLYILRRTVGYGKQEDTISLSQFARGVKRKDGTVLDHGTGLCKRTVQAALLALAEKGLIEISRATSKAGDPDLNTYRVLKGSC